MKAGSISGLPPLIPTRAALLACTSTLEPNTSLYSRAIVPSLVLHWRHYIQDPLYRRELVRVRPVSCLLSSLVSLLLSSLLLLPPRAPSPLSCLLLPPTSLFYTLLLSISSLLLFLPLARAFLDESFVKLSLPACITCFLIRISARPGDVLLSSSKTSIFLLLD